jgi:hypothetical protein
MNDQLNTGTQSCLPFGSCIHNSISWMKGRSLWPKNGVFVFAILSTRATLFIFLWLRAQVYRARNHKHQPRYLARRQTTFRWTSLYLVQPIATKRQHSHLIWCNRLQQNDSNFICGRQTTSRQTYCAVLTELAPTIYSATLYLARRQPTFVGLYSIWCNQNATDCRQRDSLSCAAIWNLVQSDAPECRKRSSVLRDESQGSAALYSFWRSLIRASSQLNLTQSPPSIVHALSSIVHFFESVR